MKNIENKILMFGLCSVLVGGALFVMRGTCTKWDNSIIVALIGGFFTMITGIASRLFSNIGEKQNQYFSQIEKKLDSLFEVHQIKSETRYEILKEQITARVDNINNSVTELASRHENTINLVIGIQDTINASINLKNQQQHYQEEFDNILAMRREDFLFVDKSERLLSAARAMNKRLKDFQDWVYEIDLKNMDFNKLVDEAKNFEEDFFICCVQFLGQQFSKIYRQTVDDDSLIFLMTIKDIIDQPTNHKINKIHYSAVEYLNKLFVKLLYTYEKNKDIIPADEVKDLQKDLLPVYSIK